jgi:hypothetical protein
VRAHALTMVAIARGSPLRALPTKAFTIARCLVTSSLLLPSVIDTISLSSSRRSDVNRRAAGRIAGLSSLELMLYRWATVSDFSFFHSFSSAELFQRAR